MDNKCYITEPSAEIRALALAYVQSQDISGLTPEAVLNLYDDVLRRMWEHYCENFV